MTYIKKDRNSITSNYNLDNDGTLTPSAGGGSMVAVSDKNFDTSSVAEYGEGYEYSASFKYSPSTNIDIGVQLEVGGVLGTPGTNIVLIWDATSTIDFYDATVVFTVYKTSETTIKYIAKLRAHGLTWNNLVWTSQDLPIAVYIGEEINFKLYADTIGYAGLVLTEVTLTKLDKDY